MVLVALTLVTAAPEAAPASSPLVITPKGNGWIAFVSDRDGNNEIYRMDFDGQDQIDLTNNPASDNQPAWSPDGKKIAFTTGRDGNNEIYVMNSDGSGQTNLTNNPASDSQPAWSPDGKRIAFTTDRKGDNEIYVMNADGSRPMNLTNNPASDSQPAWSPDGKKIAFTTDRDSNTEIYVMTRSGGGQANVTGNPGSDSQAAWSPAGDKIAFTSDRSGDNDIYVMASNGTGVSNVTNNPASDTEPVFAPDQGYRMSFTSDRDGDSEVYVTWKAGTGQEQFNLTHSTGSSDSSPDWQPLPQYPSSGSPIKHVVVIFQENQSFDSVLGKLCLQDARCDSVSQGELLNGDFIPLRDATDVVPAVGHSWFAQQDGINGGLMNGFEQIQGCSKADNYACYQQFAPGRIPSLAALARSYVISDRTFQTDPTGSWGAHLNLASSHLDGFYQGGHAKGGGGAGEGGGCDSSHEGPWAATLVDYFGNHYPDPPSTKYPNCIPAPDGTGPFRPSAVPWTPTIMDRLDAAGRTWKLYASQPGDGSYGWSICPTFADCIFTQQNLNHVDPAQFAQDAMGGVLPSLSILIPKFKQSQHNGGSMLEGDNWISSNVQAVMSGSDWASTAIFITWDDCGCFYDHAVPPGDYGIRAPMVIVSPFARPVFTDSTIATFASMLAFTEHTFGLAPLSISDATAYDYSSSFDYTQSPLQPIPLRQYPLPPWEVKWLEKHPPPADDT
jgi:TolB protein